MMMEEQIIITSKDRRQQQQKQKQTTITASISRHQSSGLYRSDSIDSLNLTLEPPNFVHFRTLICVLLLSTFLVVCSAYDAKSKCVGPNNLSYFTFDEDFDYDEQTIEEIMEECTATFRSIIIPVATSTVVFGFISLFVVHRHLRYVERTCESMVPSHLLALLVLFVPLLCMGITWTYGIFAIMLRPKLSTTYYENPFKSLAAVDKLGWIGGNANLYYLSWSSEILVMILMYSVVVDIARWWHRGMIPQEGTSRRVILPTPSFKEQIHQIMLSSTSASNLASLYRIRRKSWYDFLIRLRERSGYWVVAFISSSLVLASSTYLFFEILLNLARDISNGNDVKYTDVCVITQGYESLPEQYCKRTLFAMLSGAVATVLSLVAIILHVVFRRNHATDVNHSCAEMEISIHAISMLEPGSSISLRVEFILSLIPSVFLGLNAVFATGGKYSYSFFS